MQLKPFESDRTASANYDCLLSIPPSLSAIKQALVNEPDKSCQTNYTRNRSNIENRRRQNEKKNTEAPRNAYSTICAIIKE